MSGEEAADASLADTSEVRSFKFDSEKEKYGFVNVGAKVCEVTPDSLADRLGVRPGWYVALVDGEELLGATSNLCRRMPTVTTEEVRSLLREKRCLSVRQDRPVEITFWTAPARPHSPRLEDYPEELRAESVEDLKNILVELYGSIIAAWDEALDVDGSGTLDYKEFVAACRTVGFKGSLKKIYSDLDKDGGGSISIHELDPTCKMDFSKGLCFVCTLPNPCEKHSDAEQQRMALRSRKKIERNRESNRSASH
eukprot:gnl/TRDRNA2_/TRDRNA2_150371_c0_seq1.p1 gnl/TRDRNA2_/TRDRNA2_150371_c0~~gnl/TRDRNA2_/TRDRNA2_150371_c0_seq1.p1  ORF type:complete len:264 (-),score=52.22 gnl/TRDRNA2_/TRDRNA2_150371_c0_seq1:104-862(-)